MTAHVHFDIEDMIRRTRAGIESGAAAAIAAAPDEDSKRFYEIQRRLHLAHVEGHAELLRFFNEGHDAQQIANAAAVVTSAAIHSYEGLFGTAFNILLARQMQRVQAGAVAHPGHVEIVGTEGGRA